MTDMLAGGDQRVLCLRGGIGLDDLGHSTRESSINQQL
jgi:hypothetical protein